MAELIPLKDAIQDLRKELQAAMQAGEGEALRFQVGNIELELNVVVTREAQASGKLEFKILGWGAEAGGGAKLADQRSHKVKLVLTPRRGDGGEVLVRDSEP